jgi:hypothetical protein
MTPPPTPDAGDELEEILTDDLLGPEAAPDSQSLLAGLLSAARGPAEGDELAAEATIVAAMADAIDARAGATLPPRHRGRLIRRVVAAKTTVAAAIVLGVAAAAAATGVVATTLAPHSDDRLPRDPTPATSAPRDDTGDGAPVDGTAGPFCPVVEALCPVGTTTAPSTTAGADDHGARGNGDARPDAGEPQKKTQPPHPTQPTHPDTPGKPSKPGNATNPGNADDAEGTDPGEPPAAEAARTPPGKATGRDQGSGG